MIATIANEIKRVCKAHKDIKGFTYDLPSKVLGTGEKKYPHFFLESPIIGADFDTENGGVVNFTVNCCVLLFGGSASVSQQKAEQYLYQICSEINRADTITIESISVMGLMRYTDDSTSGVRATLGVSVINDYSRCDNNPSVFDIDNTFDNTDVLKDINTENASSCETSYHSKLKKINL